MKYITISLERVKSEFDNKEQVYEAELVKKRYETFPIEKEQATTDDKVQEDTGLTNKDSETTSLNNNGQQNNNVEKAKEQSVEAIKSKDGQKDISTSSKRGDKKTGNNDNEIDRDFFNEFAEDFSINILILTKMTTMTKSEIFLTSSQIISSLMLM